MVGLPNLIGIACFLFTLAAYVGETVVIRYDPRDLAEIRVFYEDHYLCTAISPEISDYTVDLKDIISARNKRKRSLKNQITPEKTLIEEIIHSKQSQLEAGSEKTEPIKMTQTFIETKEYKRFAEFCDACIKYQYMGICYGLPGVGKTLSARQYARWDYLDKQINYEKVEFLDAPANEKILDCHTLFYTAPPVSATKLTGAIHVIGMRLNIVKDVYRARIGEKELNTSNAFEGINLIIVDEIDRLKLQHLEQLRDIYDQHDLAMIFIGMPGIEKRLARYPQLYSRIGFAHEYQKLSKDEMHHILEYKWDELGISIKREDFSDYEALTNIMKVTNGNFRMIHRLFTQFERILEINHLTSITTEVVEAARNSLVIGHN